MPELTVTLQLRELADGGFEATSEAVPGLQIHGTTAGETLERARHRLAGPPTFGATAVADAPTAVRRPSQRSTVSDGALLRQYMILDHVEQEEHLSQRDLARLLDLNLATVNQVLKRLVRKGCIKTRRINGRRLAYCITPQGFAEKMRLVLAYTRQTISFFSTVRDLVNVELRRLKEEEGIHAVAIIGTGELAEAVFLSAREQGLEVGAVFDRDHGSGSWLGHQVLWPVDQHAADFEALILADIRADGATDGTVPTTEAAWSETPLPVVDLAHLLSTRMGAFARRINTEALD